jgi:hypothetical protein
MARKASLLIEAVSVLKPRLGIEIPIKDSGILERVLTRKRRVKRCVLFK